MRRYINYLIVIFTLLTGCDDRAFEFQQARFTFSASIEPPQLTVNGLYELSLQIRLKDGVTEVPFYKLSWEVQNGNGVLFRKGLFFDSGSSMHPDDVWAYQPTSVGKQTLVLTLSDETDVQLTVSLDLDVVDISSIPFSFTATFTDDEITIQTDAEFTVDLTSEDPNAQYFLNAEVVQGAGTIKDAQGNTISEDHPVAIGATRWSYFATTAGQNTIRLTIRDGQGNVLTRDLIALVSDRIPFTVTASAEPGTLRQNKHSLITLSISSTHPLFETLEFELLYSSNFGSQALMEDLDGNAISSNTAWPLERGENFFRYHPQVPGSHELNLIVIDQNGNSETAELTVVSEALLPPVAAAVSSFRLGLETCIIDDLTGTETCTATLYLDVDLTGSFDQDARLGGFITEYIISIDGVQYRGTYDPDNPVVSISNGSATYSRLSDGTETPKVYTNVLHQPGTSIFVELVDDDEQLSQVLEIKSPDSFPE